MPQDLEVTSVNVSALLEKLRAREWEIPAFQRGFVWSIGDVSDLVNSILERRPIGMATLWQQPDNSTFDLEPVSIPDRDRPAELPKPESVSTTKFAVLDGLQRCTAIAMAFGGLRPTDGRMKFCGRFFLNLAAKDDARRIEYVKEAEVVNRGITSDAAAIGIGLFPLASSDPNETLSDQWFRYAQAIHNPDNYPNSKLPDTEELQRRNDILRRSSEGLMATKLAVNIVPSSYSLVDVCGIFEVLNTSGTKVSTVDLIHSWLYADTYSDETPLLLRDWIDKLGDQRGAVGWSSSTDRPELIAQMTTAAYVALESKPEPRTVGRTRGSSVISVKSGDLLATPTPHWKNVIAREDQFAEFLGDFQQCVADGAFGWKACPYPVTASIYVSLRWHHHFDRDKNHVWGIRDLDALFRSFFWRNALSSRYDQGFLTQLGTDIVELKRILNGRSSFGSFEEWASEANRDLDAFMDKSMPDPKELRDLFSGRQTGALQKALLLPIVAGARNDLLSPEVNISFPARTDIQLHHIYPRAWCRDNCTGDLSEWLDHPRVADKDWVGSAANLMPLTRESNLEWQSANPGKIIHQKNLSYDTHDKLFSDVFINKQAFHHLSEGAGGIPRFWNARAHTLASHIEKQIDVAGYP